MEGEKLVWDFNSPFCENRTMSLCDISRWLYLGRSRGVAPSQALRRTRLFWIGKELDCLEYEVDKQKCFL